MLLDLWRAAHGHFVLLLTASAILVSATACRNASPPTKRPARADARAIARDGKRQEADADRPDDPSIQPAAATDNADSHAPPRTAESGQQLYGRHCAACHGNEGDGRGLAAAFVFPKPRNIQAGRFRLISTSNGVPSRDDLHAILLRGMPGSSMPPWGHLSQDERDALVDEVLRLRSLGARALYVRVLKEEEGLTDEEIADEDVQEEIQGYVDRFTTPGDSTVVPEIGEPTEEGLVRAQETYARFGCLQCHGKDGKGDGVQKMTDDEGYPTAPRDFTAGIFKGGADPASLYRRIAYGMPGTPMPSSNQMTPEQMVELVHYIRAMSTEAQRQAAVLNREQIVVKALDELPKTASDDAWAAAPTVSPRMTPLWWRNDADPGLQVQAVHDGHAIAVRISWLDHQQDQHAASSASFEDAVAMQVYRGDAEPFLGMGGPKSAVDVWYWDADRQGTPLAVEALYPRAVVDVFPFSETAVTTAELDRDGARTSDQPDISLPARAAGNQIVPRDGESGASSLAGAGPGTSTFRPPTSQHVHAVGQWKDGRWTVVMTRPLVLDTVEDGVSLVSGDKASVAFAVWDGAALDRDGKKLITIWQDLLME